MSTFQFATRSLLRARTFTIASIATIALAIGAGCAVFGLVVTVLVRPLPYPSADRLVGLWHAAPGLGVHIAKLSPGTLEIYKQNARSFEDIGLYVSLAATLTYASPAVPAERVRAGFMTPSAFAVLGAHPLIGRLFTDSESVASAPPVALISERLWTARFDRDPSILGRTIEINGAASRIIGVMPASFAFPEATTPVWAPLDVSHNSYAGSFGYDGIGRLRPGVTNEAARRELQQILTRLPERFPELRPGMSTAVLLRQARLSPVVHAMRDDVVAGFDRVLWLIGGTVALLVIVAFSNVASLLLVRIESRRREFAVRSALGGSPWRVWESLMAEAVIIAGVGGLLGFGLAALALSALVDVAPTGLPRLNELHVDASVVFAALALTALFVLVGGAIGAMRIRSNDAMRVLREAGRTGTSGRAAQRMRATFVAVEVALSLVLLTGSGVLARSVMKLRAVQPGFDPSNTFTFWTFLPGTRYRHSVDAARFYREAIARFERIPGVVSVATTNKLPLEIEGFPYELPIWADDGSSTTDAIPPVFQTTTTSSGYFGTMHIPMLAGRTYDDANVRRGVNEAVVSRGFIERFWHDATGRSGVGHRVRVTSDGPWYTIVGVVEDVRDSTLTQPPISEAYFPEEAPDDSSTAHASTTARDMAFVVRTRPAAAGMALRLESELHALDANLPFYRPATMEQIVTDARSRMTFALDLLAVGAITTLALGIVGLYGVIAYVVSLRAREISIRIALGLPPAGAATMILKQGETIVVAGAAAGLVIFLIFSRLLATIAFEVSPIDATTLAAALIVVLVVATSAIWLPARRASRVAPADALKSD